MTREIPLTQGKVALVDADDFEWLNQWKWHVLKEQAGTFRALRGARVGGNYTNIAMARFIVDAPKGLVVDHINHNTLDNRRTNLRICTLSGNNRNTSSRRNSFSQYLGVDYDKSDGRWRARVRVGSVRHFVGKFDSEQDAARAYDAAACFHHGEFANPNFPLGLK